MISLDKILKKKLKKESNMSSKIRRLAVFDPKVRSEQIFEEVKKIKNHKCFYCSEMIKNDDDLKIVCKDVMTSYIKLNQNIFICCLKCKENALKEEESQEKKIPIEEKIFELPKIE